MAEDLYRIKNLNQYSIVYDIQPVSTQNSANKYGRQWTLTLQ